MLGRPASRSSSCADLALDASRWKAGSANG